jgi:hypothetical protein
MELLAILSQANPLHILTPYILTTPVNITSCYSTPLHSSSEPCMLHAQQNYPFDFSTYISSYSLRQFAVLVSTPTDLPKLCKTFQTLASHFCIAILSHPVCQTRTGTSRSLQLGLPAGQLLQPSAQDPC